jgi:CheY-like chemotaxis protein
MSEKYSTSKKPLRDKDPPTATRGYVVLLLESEVLDRGSTAVHLRTSGFDVIETTDAEEARRVLDSARVDVVFMDLAMPDQRTALAVLRWLRESHPAIKLIVTSTQEADMAGLDGYGMFLSKPYRAADFDYCLHKAFGTARTPANETSGAMTADPGKNANPEPGGAPGIVRPNRPGAPDHANCEDGESLAALSRRLAERAARNRAVDPAAAKAARRAALKAYDRARRQRLALGFAVAAIACSGIAYFVPTGGSRPVVSLPSAAALPESIALLSMAAATPTSAPPVPASFSSVPLSPSPTADVADTPAFVPAAASVTSLADGQLSPLESTPNQTPLGREEAREIQARLRSFGFNPGPVDGVPGGMTEGAITRYQRNRGLLQTGKVDREFLERLRQDPAPKLVRRAAGPYARPTTLAPPRSSNPFESVRAAGDHLGQWLDSRLR